MQGVLGAMSAKGFEEGENVACGRLIGNFENEAVQSTMLHGFKQGNTVTYMGYLEIQHLQRREWMVDGGRGEKWDELRRIRIQIEEDLP